VIELRDVGVVVRGRTILSRCTATFEPSTITHLVGVNGSGKTTLIRAIAGLQRHSGSILFDGMDVARVRSSLYVCFDDAPVFPGLSGYENLRVLLGRPVARRTAASIAPAIADHALLRRPARRLSQGERRRLHLVAALLSGARFLVLDEALNGVDASGLAQTAEALERRCPESTVVITGHHSDAYGGLASRTLSLIDGELRAGARA
jgi:ABC-type multidrug transport system ATPase subunit